MDTERCTNDQCRRPFAVTEIHGHMPGTRESEDIACPYCDHTITRRSNGVFRTSALSLEFEAKYNLEHPES